LEKFTLQDEAAAADGEAGEEDEEQAAAAAHAKPTTSDADSDDNEGKQFVLVRGMVTCDCPVKHKALLAH
jgi:hypothetical protein